MVLRRSPIYGRRLPATKTSWFRLTLCIFCSEVWSKSKYLKAKHNKLVLWSLHPTEIKELCWLHAAPSILFNFVTVPIRAALKNTHTCKNRHRSLNIEAERVFEVGPRIVFEHCWYLLTTINVGGPTSCSNGPDRISRRTIGDQSILTRHAQL